MPNITEQRVDASGIYIQASDGREITLTKGQIRAMHVTAGTKAAGKQSIMQRIEDALGVEQVPITRTIVPSSPNPNHDPNDVHSQELILDYANEFEEAAMVFDYDESDGTPLQLDMS